MAITSIGTFCILAGSGGGTTLTGSPSAQLDVGNYGLIAVAVDNTGTTDADFSEVTSITDSVGNVWTKLGEWTNGQGAAGAGVTSSLWGTKVTANLSTAGTITINFSTSPAGDRCASGWEFSVGASQTLQVAVGGLTQNATDGANGFGSLALSGLPSKQYLFFRALAKEVNSTTNLTPTTNYTAITSQRSRNNASAVIVRGEFRIVTATGETSNPTLAVVGDTASVFVALEEVDASGYGMLLSYARKSLVFCNDGEL